MFTWPLLPRQEGEGAAAGDSLVAAAEPSPAALAAPTAELSVSDAEVGACCYFVLVLVLFAHDIL